MTDLNNMEKKRARGSLPELKLSGARYGTDQQELLHLQVVAEVLTTFLIDMISPPFIVS
jgi:hypothetical protein